jgi:endo-1,4-beta-xylanase
MVISRRSVLAGATVLLGSACTTPFDTIPEALTPLSSAPLPQTIGALAASKSMRFGSAVGAGPASSGSFRNPQYAALLKNDCALLVAENEMKWQALRPSEALYNFAPFDEMLDFADDNRLAMRGHTLLWHRPQWQPRWLEVHDYGSRPASEAERLLTAHIKAVTNRYRGKIVSYDVVNETVLEDSTLAQTAISRAIGGTETLVDLAFFTARTQLPDAELVYNDYMSWEPGNEKHRAGVLKLLEGFRKRDVPVDALGIQSHIRIDSYEAGTAPRQEREWRNFLDAVTAMGYRLLITEFDVNDQALPADIEQRDRSVAAFAKAYLDIMFSYPQLRDVLVWGMQDHHSWLQQFQPTRMDGEPKRPNIYDDKGLAKPLYTVLAQAFQNTFMRA